LISKAKKEEGIVTLFFRVSKDGEITNIKIIKSSGYEKLDEAALKSVKSVGKYKAIPSELENDYLDIQVPIKFNLN
jgi:periplasmic protein TonB